MELVSGSATDPAIVAKIDRFAAGSLNKVVVRCADTPGFVANRIGSFWLWSALEAALACGLEVETADAVLRAPFGAPVGPFAFLDLVGIDLAPTALASLKQELPEDDALQTFSSEQPLIADMIRLGRTGRKAGGGFVRKAADGSQEVLDLKTLDYRKARASASPLLTPTTENLRANSRRRRAGWTFRLDRHVPHPRLRSCSCTVGGAVPDLVDVAMREGYGWSQGPFAQIEVNRASVVCRALIPRWGSGASPTAAMAVALT